MQFLNNYTLECSANSNKKKYGLIASISPFFKLFGVISLVGLFWSVYFLIVFVVLWIISMSLNYYKNKLVFTYKYSIYDQRFLVYKEDLLYKKQKLVDMELIDILSCNIGDTIDDTPKYYDKNYDNGFVVTIDSKNGSFAIICDEYMYSVLCFKINKKEVIE